MNAPLLSRAHRYATLVAHRKGYDPTPLRLANPSAIDGGRYDSDHVGPWTLWAHDFNADLMVVGQDWGDDCYFAKNKGFDEPGNPTNDALMKLLASVGRPIPAPPTKDDVGDPARSSCRVWLTNALLWLKTGGLSAPVRSEWFGGQSMAMLRAQIDIVAPRVIVALGQHAYDCLRGAFDLPRRRGPFRVAVEEPIGVALPSAPDRAMLFAVYHCGARIQNTLRPLDQQLLDWQRVKRGLAEP